MSKILLSAAVCLLALFVGTTNFARARRPVAAPKDDNLAARQLENVRLEAQSIGSLLSELSLANDIPIGLELAPDDDEFATYHIDFQKGTLSDLLTQFVTRHSQYTWEIKDGVVNVFPKDKYREVLFRALLATKISRFAIKEKTNCWALAQSLVATPEIKKILAANGATYRDRSFSGGYIPQLGRHFTLDVANMTLKSILNKVIEESPTARFWLITRNSYDRTLFISLSARHEDSPAGSEKLAVPQ